MRQGDRELDGPVEFEAEVILAHLDDSEGWLVQGALQGRGRH